MGEEIHTPTHIINMVLLQKTYTQNTYTDKRPTTQKTYTDKRPTLKRPTMTKDLY